MLNGYKPRERPVFQLAGGDAQKEMVEFLEKGREKGWFFPHDVTVAGAVAEIMTGGLDADPVETDEKDLFSRERQAFIKLAKTKETHERIFGLLRNGNSIRN